MSLLDKPFNEPSRLPWPIWPIAIVVAFSVGTCEAHTTAPSHKTATVHATTTTTTAPIPRLAIDPGYWAIAGPGCIGPGAVSGGTSDNCTGTLGQGTNDVEVDTGDAGDALWCGDPSSPGWEVIYYPEDPTDPPTPTGHACTWPELQTQGWVKVGGPSKPTHHFVCADHECSVAELKKAKWYEGSIHDLLTP